MKYTILKGEKIKIKIRDSYLIQIKPKKLKKRYIQEVKKALKSLKVPIFSYSSSSLSPELLRKLGFLEDDEFDGLFIFKK